MQNKNDVKQGQISVAGALTLVAVMIILIFLSVNAAVFYYKYENSVALFRGDLQKQANSVADKYVQFFEKSGGDIENFQNFINSNLLGDVYLLQDNGKNGYKILASTSKELKIGEDYADLQCGDVSKHDFIKRYFYKRILPDNIARACVFTPSGEYIVGFKGEFIRPISGFEDPDFTEWLSKNMFLTIVFSSVAAIFGIISCLWLAARYVGAKNSYEKVKEQSAAQIASLQEQLYIDPVTGLLNKFALVRDIAECKSPKAVLIDIDDFGKMNDFYGRYVCDQILIYMADLIREFAQKENMSAYCVSVDRFALIEDADFFIDRYEDLANDFLGNFKGRVISVTDEDGAQINDIEIHTTIGFCIDKEHTLRKAAVALKTAKQLNKDYVCYFKGLNQKEGYEDQILRSRLIQKAIINGNVAPYYQPITDRAGEIVKYECLIRIIDSAEVVSPHLFLGISKRIKRYAELEKMLIMKSVDKLIEQPHLTLSINLSGRDMTDGDVSALLINLLNKYKIADRIVFEIVEDEDVRNVQRVSTFIERVKKMGAKIAIDDFGSGYSNFSYIQKIKPDYIKLDGSIIKDIDVNKDSFVIARAIVAFARDLGIKTIAEYVHSKEILQICKDIGVDEFQGYYIGVPSEETNACKL